MATKKPPQLSEIILRTGMVSWSIVGILLVLWAMVFLLGLFDVLLAPVVISVALIYILNPVVKRLERAHIHRLVGTAISFVMLTAALVLVGFLVIPSVTEQASALASDFPAIYEDSAVQIEDMLGTAGVTVNVWSYDEVEAFFNDPDNQDQLVSAVLDRIGALTSGLLEAFLVFFVAPVIAFYVLIDLPRLRRETVSLIPRKHRDEVVFVAREVGTAVGGFLRGQLLVAVIVGVLTSFGFWLIGLNFWLIIGMIAGFLNIIPFVGPWVGGALGVIVGLVTGSVPIALSAAVVALIVQQIDNNFVSPTVLRATVRLHPAVVILALIVGGAIGGLWGVLLVVPVTAAIKIIAGHLWRTRVLGQTWEEASQHLIDENPGERLRDRMRREAAVEAADAAASAVAATDLEEAAGAVPDEDNTGVSDRDASEE